jgi:rubrerythrin
MFTKADLINYLSDIEITEINMRDIYEEAQKYIDNPKIIAKFQELSKQEENHRFLVSNLKKLVMNSDLKDD